jgi:prevent-host-death family protein
MGTVNISEAKAQRSRLVDSAAEGEPFIIAKSGEPLVKVVPLDSTPQKKPRRLGFLEGQIKIPEDFDTMCAAEIEEMFYGKP